MIISKITRVFRLYKIIKSKHLFRELEDLVSFPVINISTVCSNNAGNLMLITIIRVFRSFMHTSDLSTHLK